MSRLTWITPHETVARSRVEAREQHDQVSTVGMLGNQLRLVPVTVPESLEEKTLSAVTLPESAHGIARIRAEEVTALAAEGTLPAKDQLLPLVAEKGYDALLDMFAESDDA